ncbi:VOC family protein [Chitinophaga caseinilytica]|uniref:VOC family protein n=1 Tax=Chitinophaga caseinilytica TaxID=2267521 RepID=A0ABZ2Z3A7_9BACT
MATMNPYLNFNGNCAEAFEYYKSVLGGEFTGPGMMRMKDAPPSPDMPMDPKDADLVMHVALPVGNNVLMGSDCPPAYGPVNQGNASFVSLSTADEAESKRIFDGLSAGGKVSMPLGPTFWSPLFGMCTDKFGIQWMVGMEHKPQ